jgi:glycerophosphoryl diester phosphodiesterase
MAETRRVRCIAHRGGGREAPEGTLHAFRRAAALGCDALELDVRRTADGEVVVLHDEVVDRITDGSGEVAALALAEVQALDAAWAFAPGIGPDPSADAHPLRGRGGPDLRIPTLAELLVAVPGVPLVIDLKVGPPEEPDVPEQVARLLRAAGRGDDVIVGSFSQVRLDAFRALAPGVPTSATQDEAAAFWAGEPIPDVPGFAALQVPARFGDVDVVTADFVDRAHASGVEVHVWTVDDPDEVRRLVGLGVDGIVTDVPEAVSAVLVDLGVR